MANPVLVEVTRGNLVESRHRGMVVAVDGDGKVVFSQGDIDAAVFPRSACKAMQGLVAEAKELLEEDADPQVMDAALIVAAQKVEHYEIATYGTLIALARTLGYDNAVVILKETLVEEKICDELLTHLAMDEGINEQALKKTA